MTNKICAKQVNNTCWGDRPLLNCPGIAFHHYFYHEP